MALSRELAKFVVGLKYEDLPSDIVGIAKTLILDSLGIALFTSNGTFWGRVIAQLAASEGKGHSSIIGYGTRTSPSFAALANGTMILGFELEDTHPEALSHIGPVVVSSVLAVGEKERASGRDIITAVVAGYDVMARIGCGAGKALIARGLHPTANNGTFGASAVTGKLMRLSEEQMVQAFGLAGVQSSGLMQAPDEGVMARRLYAGKPAQSGVIAAQLASLGFTGPEEVLEGEHGYYKVYADSYDLHRVTEGLGRIFEISRITYKPYSACRVFHASIGALLNLRAKYSIRPGDVAEIVGSIRFMSLAHARKDPTTVMGAQYSLPYSLAVTLHKGVAGPSEYTEELIKDREILATAQKVKVDFSKELDEKYPNTLPGAVTIKLKDGRTYSEEAPYPKGDPENPMSEKELREKYRALASRLLSQSQVAEVEQTVDKLEVLKDIAELTKLLAPRGAAVDRD